MTSRNESGISRREVLQRVAGGAALLAATGLGAAARAQEKAPVKRNGRIKQSVSKWCYGKIPLRDFCKACVEMGLGGVDLVGPGDWAVLKEFGLIGTVTPSHGIGKGFNRKENHEECIASVRKAIEETAAAGYPNVICFSGNRAGLSDEEGAANCVEGLKKIVGFAEEKKVTLVMELLNSKRNHKDYQCDHTAWGADVCKRVGSPRMKLLYDIYHMQIQEGDIIATLKDFLPFIGHVHTGGVPGRNEIDDTQEIFYPAVMKALIDLKYDGWVAHEFVPKRDPLTSLRQAVEICDV